MLFVLTLAILTPNGDLAIVFAQKDQTGAKQPRRDVLLNDKGKARDSQSLSWPSGRSKCYSEAQSDVGLSPIVFEIVSEKDGVSFFFGILLLDLCPGGSAASRATYAACCERGAKSAGGGCISFAPRPVP
jgi:hypothetical protein